MKKKEFYLIMTLISLIFFTGISVVLTCIMPSTKGNAILMLTVCVAGNLITLCWFDSFTKSK